MSQVDYEIFYSKKKGFFSKELPCLGSVELDANELVVRPQWVGICGSDLTTLDWYQGDNLRLGHEWIGVVERVGAKVSKFAQGDQVTSTAILGCGNCSYCKEHEDNLCETPTILGSDQLGGLRSWIKFQEHHLVKIPGTADITNVLLELFAVGEEAYDLLKHRISSNGKVLIVGSGPVGIATAIVFKSYGIDSLLLELEPTRIKLATQRGLEVVHSAMALTDLSLKNNFDFIVDASGDRDGAPGGWKYLDHFGKKHLVALIIGKYINNPSIRSDKLANLKATLLWMKGMGRNRLQLTVGRWVGEIDKYQDLITHCYLSEEVTEAFETAKKKKDSLKVIIDLNQLRPSTWETSK